MWKIPKHRNTREFLKIVKVFFALISVLEQKVSVLVTIY